MAEILPLSQGQSICVRYIWAGAHQLHARACCVYQCNCVTDEPGRLPTFAAWMDRQLMQVLLLGQSASLKRYKIYNNYGGHDLVLQLMVLTIANSSLHQHVQSI